jgi:hypothetical protein
VLAPAAGAARPGVPYPRYPAFLAAVHFAAHRLGDVSFAVMRSDGALRSFRGARRAPSASVVKAMLLAAYLRSHHHLSPQIKAVLSPMVRFSDNGAAEAIYRIVGAAGLQDVGRAAGMTRLVTGVPLFDTGITANDQVRFFWHLNTIIPRYHVAYARELLRTVTPAQSWGIPFALRPLGWHVFFKGGWRGGLTHQSAQVLIGNPRRGTLTKLAISVLTTGSPSMAYAEGTIAGIARRLVRGYRHPRARSRRAPGG